MADDNECGDGFRPSDSVSHCTETSGVHAAAERQKLLIQAKFAKQRNELELERLHVEGELQQLQVEALIEAAVIAEAATVDSSSPRGQADTLPTVSDSSLNPMAAEWPVSAANADNPLPAKRRLVLLVQPVLRAQDKNSLQELADDVRACKESLEAISI